jgi:chlorite dismutase
MAQPLDVAFAGGSSGSWRIERITPIRGEGLPDAERLEIFEGAPSAAMHSAHWILRGVTSNTRYTTRHEVNVLAGKQAGLSRPEASRAALIPIRKTAAWWDLAQDERRAIFEEQSRHIAIGTEYLPGVARRLHHSRELGESFDFLTWFEFAPEHAEAFDRMLDRLRQTPEWRYVDREVDIRLGR